MKAFCELSIDRLNQSSETIAHLMEPKGRSIMYRALEGEF